MIDAKKIPVPVADSQLKLKTAASLVGFATTGGIRITNLSSQGTGNFGAEMPSRSVLIWGNPHKKTTTLRTIHGNQARKISFEGWSFVLCALNFVLCSSGETCSRPVVLSLSCRRQMRFGCQNLRNS